MNLMPFTYMLRAKYLMHLFIFTSTPTIMDLQSIYNFYCHYVHFGAEKLRLRNICLSVQDYSQMLAWSPFQNLRLGLPTSPHRCSPASESDSRGSLASSSEAQLNDSHLTSHSAPAPQLPVSPCRHSPSSLPGAFNSMFPLPGTRFFSRLFSVLPCLPSGSPQTSLPREALPCSLRIKSSC